VSDRPGSRGPLGPPDEPEPPAIEVAGRWERALAGGARPQLEEAVRAYLQRRRWFAGKARAIGSLEICDALPLRSPELPLAVALGVRVAYAGGGEEAYVVPLAAAGRDRFERLPAPRPPVAARLVRGSEQLLLYDGLRDPALCRLLFDVVSRRRRVRGSGGVLAGRPTAVLAELAPPGGSVEVAPADVEQTNASVVLGGRVVLKLLCRVEAGVSPELELGLALTGRGFRGAPRVAGALEYVRDDGRRFTVGVLHEAVPAGLDAWAYTLGELRRYYRRAAGGRGAALERLAPPRGGVLELAGSELPAAARELAGSSLRAAALLGRRTAELHVALAAVPGPDFAPVPFTRAYQRSLAASMRGGARQSLLLLRRAGPGLAEPERELARAVLGAERELRARFDAVADRPLSAMRARLHGDLHLGQALRSGRDFVIVDFEGEPARPLAERREKGSPLRDVASMLRSFDYDARAGARALGTRSLPGPAADAARRVERARRLWSAWAAAAFLRSYLEAAAGAPYLPSERAELAVLLDAFALEKAVYELRYELEARPGWVGIPLAGILALLGRGP